MLNWVIIIWKDHGVLMKNAISWLHVIILFWTSVDDVYEELCILINIGSFICIWVLCLIWIVNACSWFKMSKWLLLCMFLFFLMIYVWWMTLYAIGKSSFFVSKMNSKCIKSNDRYVHYLSNLHICRDVYNLWMASTLECMEHH